MPAHRIPVAVAGGRAERQGGLLADASARARSVAAALAETGAERFGARVLYQDALVDVLSHPHAVSPPDGSVIQ